MKNAKRLYTWKTARSPLKVLSHLKAIKGKLCKLKEELPISHKEALNFIGVQHLEMHPTDLCNLACRGCTYGHDLEPVSLTSFPIGSVHKLAALKPSSLVFAGGGEPTLYKNMNVCFPQLVEGFHGVIPNIKMALITNGTYKPDGDWMNLLSWVRLSLDAATSSFYFKQKGKDLFWKTMENFKLYVQSRVPYVGIGFVYQKDNIHEYVETSEFIFDFVMDNFPKELSRVNVQYRPMRYDFPLNYTAHQLNQGDIDYCATKLARAKRHSKAFASFVTKQTNINAFISGNKHQPRAFNKCNYSQIFKIIRANGDIHACCVAINTDLHKLGNIITDSPLKIAAAQRALFEQRTHLCTPELCHLSRINETIERGLAGKARPLPKNDENNDLMF